MNLHRLASSAKGRSRASTFNGLCWIVANAKTTGANFFDQVNETFAGAEETLKQTGSSKERMISVQVFLSDMKWKDEFDRLWNEWIGSDPQHWPQRLCVEARLVPGLMVELQIVAALNIESED